MMKNLHFCHQKLYTHHTVNFGLEMLEVKNVAGKNIFWSTLTDSGIQRLTLKDNIEIRKSSLLCSWLSKWTKIFFQKLVLLLPFLNQDSWCIINTNGITLRRQGKKCRFLDAISFPRSFQEFLAILSIDGTFLSFFGFLLVPWVPLRSSPLC